MAGVRAHARRVRSWRRRIAEAIEQGDAGVDKLARQLADLEREMDLHDAKRARIWDQCLLLLDRLKGKRSEPVFLE